MEKLVEALHEPLDERLERCGERLRDRAVMEEHGLHRFGLRRDHRDCTGSRLFITSRVDKLSIKRHQVQITSLGAHHELHGAAARSSVVRELWVVSKAGRVEVHLHDVCTHDCLALNAHVCSTHVHTSIYAPPPSISRANCVNDCTSASTPSGCACGFHFHCSVKRQTPDWRSSSLSMRSSGTACGAAGAAIKGGGMPGSVLMFIAFAIFAKLASSFFKVRKHPEREMYTTTNYTTVRAIYIRPRILDWIQLQHREDNHSCLTSHTPNEYLSTYLEPHSDQLVVGGDFNCVLDTRCDRLGKRHLGADAC